MSPVTRSLLVAFVLVLLGGCRTTAEGFDEQPPPDAIAILVMTTGGDGEQTRWRIKSLRGADQTGTVTPGAESTCVLVSPGWTVDVFEIGPPEVALGRSASGRFVQDRPVRVAIEIDDTGKAEITDGRPGWWVAKEPFCDASPGG